jgi:hypothetical protein
MQKVFRMERKLFVSCNSQGGVMKKRVSIASAIIIFVAFVMWSATARAQEARYVEYGFSFQPPAGWQQDEEAEGAIRVQYFGPRREDGSQPKLNLSVQNYALNLGEQQINSLTTEMVENISGLGMKDPKVIFSGKTMISGHEAMQIDYSYNQDGTPTRLRQVYVPVSDHKRTYLFTFVDKAQHFDQTAAGVQAAIGSFSTAPASASPATATPKQGEEAGRWNWVLIILGIIALAVVAGATYMLMRRRAIA